MKKIFSLIGAAALCASCIFPGGISINGGKAVTCKGPVVIKSFDFSDFDAISINGGADLELIQGQNFEVKVKANEEVFEHLEYEVAGSTLILKTKNNVGIRAEEYDVTVTLPTLMELTINGAGDVDLKNGYSSDKDLDITINGAGDLELTGIAVPSLSIGLNGAGDIEANDLNVEKLSVSINGAGDVDLSGKATKANFSVSGAGDIDARGLDCPDVQTHKSGIASIRMK